MGWYLTQHLFKGCTEQQLEAAIRDRVVEMRGRVFWDSESADGVQLAVKSVGDVHTVELAYCGGVYGFFKPIGSRLQCPWMEVRVQDGSHWDCSLMLGDEDLDHFSTYPQYYHEEEDQEQMAVFQGKPDVLSEVWGVPLEHIDRYMVNWGTGDTWLEDGVTADWDPDTRDVVIFPGIWVRDRKLKGKAYDGDEFDYGDPKQLFDFIRALGGSDLTQEYGEKPGEVIPVPGARYHRLVFPNNDNIYGRYPLAEFLLKARWFLSDISKRWLPSTVSEQ